MPPIGRPAVIRAFRSPACLTPSDSFSSTGSANCVIRVEAATSHVPRAEFTACSDSPDDAVEGLTGTQKRASDDEARQGEEVEVSPKNFDNSPLPTFAAAACQHFRERKFRSAGCEGSRTRHSITQPSYARERIVQSVIA
jgi:hypothetical protein